LYCNNDVQSEIALPPSDMQVDPYGLDGGAILEELAIREFESH
jgi:hypothetical protein